MQISRWDIDPHIHTCDGRNYKENKYKLFYKYYADGHILPQRARKVEKRSEG